MAETRRIARPYARAIFELAQHLGQYDSWSLILSGLGLIVQDELAAKFFNNPTIEAETKVEFIMAVSSAVAATSVSATSVAYSVTSSVNANLQNADASDVNAVPQNTNANADHLMPDFSTAWMSDAGKNLILLLAQSKRLLLIAEIKQFYEQYRAEAEMILKVELVSARSLSAAEQANIITALSAKHGKKIELDVKVDRGLLGGIIIKIGDAVVDGSVHGQLCALREQILDH